MNTNVLILYNSLLLLWICCIYSIGVWLFSSGFVLNRKLIHKFSSCDNVSHDNSNKFYSSARSHTPGCDFTNRYKRALILLTDGLFYDFDQFNDNSNNSEEVNFNIINNLFKKYSNQSKIYRLSQSPSLSKIQTFKSITTGGLPTFIDLSFSFTRNHILEDNLINQLKSKSKRVTFIAENSLKKLFPNELFHRSIYYSPNSEDLNLSKRLLSEIKSNDWDVIVAHFSIIDRFQHLYGFRHKETINKLNQMDDMLQRVVSLSSKDKETILFIIGDHSNGMSVNRLKGKSPFLYVFTSKELSSIENVVTDVNKIDIVPTLSLLVGIPIPFSNVGKVISSLFEFPMECQHLKRSAEFTCHEDIPVIKCLWTSISALRINVAQVQRYLAAYSETSYLLPKVIQRELDELLERYDRQWVLLDNIPSDDKPGTIESLKELRKNYENYLLQVNKQLKLSLASYDVRLICSGIIVLFLASVANFTSIYYIKSQQQLLNFCGKVLIGSVMGAITANLIRIIDFPFHQTSFNDMVFLSAVTSIVASVGSTFAPKFIAFISTKRRIFILKDMFKANLSLQGVAILSLVFSFISMFFKTLILYEESLIYYTFQSLLVLHLFDIILRKTVLLKQPINTKLLFVICLALIIIVRLTKELRRCHEQHFSCNKSEFDLNILKSSQVLFSSLFLIFTVSLVVYILSKNEATESSQMSSFCLKYLMVFSCVCICGHWALSLAKPAIIEKHLSGNEFTLAKTVIYSSAILITVAFLFPTTTDRDEHNSNPRYSSGILILAVSCLYPLFLYQDENSSIGLILIWICAALYLLILGKIGLENSMTSIVIWYLMTTYGFFITGHHNSINYIPWNITFFTNSEKFSSNVLPVVLNVFSTQILSGISLPLLATYVPYRTKSNKIIVHKPEQELWESIMNIILKYILFNGITILGVSLSAALLRNDLMAWKLFAPRYMYQSVNLLVTLTSLLFGYFLCIRIHFS